MRFIRRLLLRFTGFLRRQLDHATHVLVYRRSLSAGVVNFSGLVDPEFVPDGMAIVRDMYFNRTRIFTINYANRHLMNQSPQARALVLWQECMQQDGLRPLGLIEGELLYTPYGEPTPVPRRYRELMESERLSESVDKDESLDTELLLDDEPPHHMHRNVLTA